MDLDYIQKYQFSAEGGSGGIPLTDSDPAILSTTLLGGGNATFHLGIPGGLIVSDVNTERYMNLDVDPWAIGVNENFDSLLNMISVSEKSISVKNKTQKKSSLQPKN